MSQQSKKKLRKTIGTKHLMIIYLQCQMTKVRRNKTLYLKKQKIMKIMTDLVKMKLISILTAAMFIGIAL